MAEPVKLGEGESGEVFGMPLPYTDQKAVSSLGNQTPDSTPYTKNDGEVGPVGRHSQPMSMFGSVDLKSLALNSAEIGTTLRRFRDEMYRNQFPTLVRSFEVRCDECDSEYETEMDECEVCDSTSFSGPSHDQKRQARKFFREVNEDGQSLRSLMEYEEDYQSFFGVSVIVVRKSYQRVRKEARVADKTVETQYVAEVDSIDELVHGDPMSILPVTDENNRHGGWWTCPLHRDKYWTEDELSFDEETCVSTCPECSCRLEEVGYVEKDRNTAQTLYLQDEVVDWARHYPEMSGLDGRSPIASILKLQALIQFDRNYDMAFFDSENTEQLPNKMILAYDENIRESLSASLSKEEGKESWETGQVIYDGNPEDVDIEVLDLTPQGTLQGREQTVKRLQSQIRARFGISDAMENELTDTGGLNAEGTQIEITNRAIASATRDTKDKALDTLAEMIGLTDWEIEYVNPKRERHELNVNQKVSAMDQARREGIPYKVEDGQLVIKEHEYDPEEE